MSKQGALKLLRYLLGVGLLLWLFSRLDWPHFFGILGETHDDIGWLLAGLGLTGVGLCAGMLRWSGLLRHQGLALPFSRVFRISFIGQFFNAFMLGACGGDVFRAVAVYRETQTGSRAEASMTVLVDRLIGLFTLVLFGATLLLLRLDWIQAHGRRLVLPALFLAGLVLVGILGAVLLFRRHLFERSRFLGWLESRWNHGVLLRRGYDVVRGVVQRPRELFTAIGYSLINTVCLSLATWCFGLALLEGNMAAFPLLDVMALFPVFSILLSIPLTPGGWGVRETLFVILFAVCGMDPETAVALSFLTYLGGLAWSVFGGLLFLMEPDRTALVQTQP